MVRLPSGSKKVLHVRRIGHSLLGQATFNTSCIKYVQIFPAVIFLKNVFSYVSSFFFYVSSLFRMWQMTALQYFLFFVVLNIFLFFAISIYPCIATHPLRPVKESILCLPRLLFSSICPVSIEFSMTSFLIIFSQKPLLIFLILSISFFVHIFLSFT